MTLQDKYAAELYVLCRKAQRAGYPGYAFRILEEVIRQNPDHAAARRILGYKLRSKEWVTPFANEQLDKGNVWDDTFGWLPKDYVAKYKAGKRYRNGRWMSADLEAENCRDINHAWIVRTDHYLVRTNYSLERGVEIAKKLELFHDFFMQTFASFFSTPDQMQKLFVSQASSANLQSRLKPYRVDYFRNREEYVQRLIKKVGQQIRITNGLYFTGDRVAYFYYDPQMPNQDTLFHEATHQLFYENDRRDRAIAMDANFWIIEGIACYMESYHSENGQSLVGDPKHPRILAARHRVIADNYYIPLERFSEMGMVAFQSSREITKNYSQAAGLAHFFMLFEGGRYRDALTEHLSEIYRAGPRQRQAVHSLSDLTGVPFAELDKQYENYMRLLPSEIPQAAVRRTAGSLTPDLQVLRKSQSTGRAATEERLPPRIDVDVVSQSLEVDFAQPRGIADERIAATGNRRNGLDPSHNLGSHEDVDFIREVTVKQRTKQPASPLDQYVREAAAAQFLKETVEIDPLSGVGRMVTLCCERQDEHLGSLLLDPANIALSGRRRCDHQQGHLFCGLHESRIEWSLYSRVDDNSHGHAWSGRARRQQGIVSESGSRSDEDRVHATTQPMHNRPGLLVGNPA